MATAMTLLKSLYTYQASMLAVLVYLASPIASLVFFGIQAGLLLISMLRHIDRARRLGSNISAHEEHYRIAPQFRLSLLARFINANMRHSRTFGDALFREVA